MKAKFAYTYNPGLMDRCTPTVIRGNVIEPNTRVRIAREFNPPMFPHVFCMIQDAQGNVMSVWRKALNR